MGWLLEDSHRLHALRAALILSRAPGSIDTILAGGEAKQLLLELRRRIIRTRNRRHQTWYDWGRP
jgi:hypothetical protein